MRITQRAYAKINWALDVVGRRADGYHELDMLMQTVALSDELSFESAGALSLTVRRAPRACRRPQFGAAGRPGPDGLYRQAPRRPHSPGQSTYPVRAGLGGGSADCGAVAVGPQPAVAAGLCP